MSRKATAARVGVHRVVVDDVLRRAGVEFRDRRKLPPLNEWVDRYVDGGETTAEIAATYAASPEAVLRALKLGGIERRRATARMPPLSDADVVARYVDERLSIGATAKRLGVAACEPRSAGWGCCGQPSTRQHWTANGSSGDTTPAPRSLNLARSSSSPNTRSVWRSATSSCRDGYKSRIVRCRSATDSWPRWSLPVTATPTSRPATGWRCGPSSGVAAGAVSCDRRPTRCNHRSPGPS